MSEQDRALLTALNAVNEALCLLAWHVQLRGGNDEQVQSVVGQVALSIKAMAAHIEPPAAAPGQNERSES